MGPTVDRTYVVSNSRTPYPEEGWNRGATYGGPGHPADVDQRPEPKRWLGRRLNRGDSGSWTAGRRDRW